jgi:hypothetical protein
MHSLRCTESVLQPLCDGMPGLLYNSTAKDAKMAPYWHFVYMRGTPNN